VTKIRNRFDLAELAGAFGDLGTLIPFVVAYVSILEFEPTGLLLAFGAGLVVTGFVYRTPFPVQPMKAIGAAAVTGAAGTAVLSPAIVIGAGLATGIIWTLLGATGLAKRLGSLIPRPALLGVVMGLGFSFMLEGIRMMAQQWMFSAVLLAVTLFLLARPRIPTMLILLLAGVGYALVTAPGLSETIGAIQPQLRWPTLAWPGLTWHDLWQGTLLLALPQLPLTFGNALVAITEENNSLFPDRLVSERRVAISTGVLNLFSSAIGGVPMCHGAGGMAGHVRFGARTGGASIIMGTLLLVVALFLSDSVGTIFRLFPLPALGVILFLAGLELAVGSRDPGADKVDRFVVLATAAFAMWNIGVALIFGLATYYCGRRGWIKA